MGSRGSHEGHTAHPPPQGGRLRWAEVERLRGAKRAPWKEVVERETWAEAHLHPCLVSGWGRDSPPLQGLSC